MRRNFARASQKGFTLVELLVVVLILAILMAVALPLYLSAIANSEKRTARANMQTIANAEQSYRLRSSNHSYLSGNLSDIVGTGTTQLQDIPSNITGPGDRTYSVKLGPDTCSDANGNTVNVPDGSFSVSTSKSDDGCFVPGVTTE